MFYTLSFIMFKVLFIYEYIYFIGFVQKLNLPLSYIIVKKNGIFCFN